VPGTQLLLAEAPAKVDPAAIQLGGKVQEAVLQASRGKTDPEVQNLLPYQALDLPHGFPDGLPVGFEILMIRVVRILDSSAPDDIQDLDLIRTPPHQPPKLLDSPKNLPEVR
jgi:hypothetical protein